MRTSSFGQGLVARPSSMLPSLPFVHIDMRRAIAGSVYITSQSTTVVCTYLVSLVYTHFRTKSYSNRCAHCCSCNADQDGKDPKHMVLFLSDNKGCLQAMKCSIHLAAFICMHTTVQYQCTCVVKALKELLRDGARPRQSCRQLKKEMEQFSQL